MTASRSTSPGAILSLRFLGREEPTGGGEFPVAVYYLTFQGGDRGGLHLGAKLFVPIGKPPHCGWPVSIWCHGFGDPATDLRRWPLVAGDWRKTRGARAGGWAHDGIVTLTPWLPGCGPSQPFAAYSPFSLDRNFQAIADGFSAMRHVEAWFAERPDDAALGNVHPHWNHERQILRTDCVATPLLVYFAARWRNVEAASGLKALVADDFQPSFAYNLWYLGPAICRLPPLASAAMRCVWARNTCALANERGWPLAEFYRDAAIDLFSQSMATSVGEQELLFASKLVPPRQSEVAPLVVDAVSKSLGRVPTGLEIREWMLSDAMLDLARRTTLEEVLEAPFYQKHFAESDPFFAETVEPFSPGLPLLLVCRSGIAAVNVRGLPSFNERYRNMTSPKIQMLRSWGWAIDELAPDRNLGTSFSGGSAQRWALGRLATIP